MARRTARADAAKPLMEQIENICFGVEIESYGMNIPRAAEIVRSVIGGTISRDHNRVYDRHWCVDSEGRRWSVVRDGSVEGGFEFVTPICSIAKGDIETIQKIIRALRAAGARPTSGTGMHIHIDARHGGTGLDSSKAIARFVKIFAAREELFAKAFECSSRLQGQWCRTVDPDFIARLNQRGTDNNDDSLSLAWYGSAHTRNWARHDHYHGSRYRGINLHAAFTRGTVEVRYFNAPIRHAGKFRAYLLFVLACAAKARNGRASTARKPQIAHGNEKYAMRSYMLKLGMNGPDFKVAREHLLAPLTGNAARARG